MKISRREQKLDFSAMRRRFERFTIQACGFAGGF
jgi:hypothetical protein